MGDANRESFLPFIDRLKTITRIIELVGGHDYRSGRASTASTYLSPLTPEKITAFDALWRTAIELDPEAAITIQVQGRDLTFQRCVGDQLRGTFQEVCGDALEDDDQLALADRFKRAFLERVSEIDPEHKDEGRRFVTLVDALYEAQARLVVLAAGEPDKLFADRSAEAYQRTASHLQEMRSARWPRGGTS